MTVAILGAGIAGAAAARALADAGVAVTLYDKGRGPGGRMATRRAGELRFDHGAQYFRARNPSFAATVEAAVTAGVVAPWPVLPGEPPTMVAAQSMTGLVRFLLGDLPITCSFQATALEREAAGWRLLSAEAAAGPFEAVIVAVPSVQAVPFLAPHHPAFAEAARAARYAPCWAGLFAFADETADALERLPHDAFAADGLPWAAHDGGKPGRGGAATLVVHAGAEWSAAHLKESAETVRDRLAAILARSGLPPPIFASAHRWRYATVTEAAAVDAPFDASTGLGIAGDWLAGPRVEAAFLSGRRAAAMLLAER